jgi:hypothetical protein
MLPRCAAVDHCARSTCAARVTDAVLAALADVSTLETLKLSFCREVRDVSALARSVSLRNWTSRAPP